MIMRKRSMINVMKLLNGMICYIKNLNKHIIFDDESIKLKNP